LYRESLPIQIIDAIDRVLAAHYGFTEEELDFIPSTELRMGVNYDTTSNTGWDVTRKVKMIDRRFRKTFRNWI
jgi:hypothetical protein